MKSFFWLTIIWLGVLVFGLVLGDGNLNFLTVDDLVHQIVSNQTSELWNQTKSGPAPTLRLNLINSFPSITLMSPQTRLYGGFLLHLFAFIYLCLLLTVVLDSYFIPCLQYFSSVLRMSPQISGSTVMALGTSSPELFTNVVSVMLGECSIGTSAVVGSSIVNTLVVPGICGLALFGAEQKQGSDSTSISSINSFPVMRDLLFYGITIIIFILSIKDNSVDAGESAIFIFIYLLYIFFLYVWSNIKAVKSYPQLSLSKRAKLSTIPMSERGEVHTPPSVTANTQPDPAFQTQELTPIRTKPEVHLLEHKPTIRYLLLPFLWLLKLTIPPPSKRYFGFTFILCCGWISILTYLNLWMVSTIGVTFHLPDSIACMTLLALGSNLPELITSYIVVRKYHLADVAICHTLGSNIFDILICLGFPWFLQIASQTVRHGAKISELGQYLIPLEEELLYFVLLTLLLSTLVLYLILYLTDWQLSVRTGFLYIMAYVCYIFIVLAYWQVNVAQH